MTLTHEDLLNQRVDDLEEWVGAISDLLSETRKDLAAARLELTTAQLSLEDHRHTCSVCGANDACLETGSEAGWVGGRQVPRRSRLLRALGL